MAMLSFVERETRASHFQRKKNITSVHGVLLLYQSVASDQCLNRVKTFSEFECLHGKLHLNERTSVLKIASRFGRTNKYE